MSVKFLNRGEIDGFLNDLDNDQDGFIEYHDIEQKLDQVHSEIAPEAKTHNLHHEDREDTERHTFLRSIMATDRNRISREEFASMVQTWKIPSLEQDQKKEHEEEEYVKKMPLGRRFRACWSVNGPTYLFIALVVGMQVTFGTWQLIKYLTILKYRHAFGWGVVLAKTCAGALQPTLFFLVLSMSRYVSTFLRRSYYISRFINWDLSQAFHIKMAVVALLLATIHAIGHLTGSFLYGSQPAQKENVAAVFRQENDTRSYSDFIRTLPGWSGLTALGLFWTLAMLSMPMIRKWSYNIFQLGHLLIYPIIGLLCAHGTAQLFQVSMLGYWLFFPSMIVIMERSLRLLNGFRRIPARLEVLDSETVQITVTIPNRRYWPYKAGQYILLQVPQISFFQWHPFTISTNIGNEIRLHIKTDGDWTSKLRNMQNETGSALKYVGIDGPFGAPAQRFYDFDQTIVVGSGIGVTPFSGILADLQAREEISKSRPSLSTNSSSSSITLPKHSYIPSFKAPVTTVGKPKRAEKRRRVDFHWMVRDRNHLLWFSNLLNTVSASAASQTSCEQPRLDIRIKTHVTQTHKNISTHIYRCLLERHRTPEHPYSPLTGLINPTHFGRPDIAAIMDEHYESMLESIKNDGEKRKRKRRKVGVFFCGAPVIGMHLADRCQDLTLRGREDRSFIEYHFMTEVFG